MAWTLPWRPLSILFERDILATIVCDLVSHRLTSLFPHQLNAKIAFVSHRPTNPYPHLSDHLNETIALGDHLSHQHDLMIFYHS